MRSWERLKDIPNKLRMMSDTGKNRLVLILIIILLWIPVVGMCLGLMSLTYVIISVLCTIIYVALVVINKLW